MSPKSKSQVSEFGDSNLRCFSVTDSEVNQGNKRFWADMDSKVSKRVWEIITSLGIYGDGRKDDYEDEISKMEDMNK